MAGTLQPTAAEITSEVTKAPNRITIEQWFPGMSTQSFREQVLAYWVPKAGEEKVLEYITNETLKHMVGEYFAHYVAYVDTLKTGDIVETPTDETYEVACVLPSTHTGLKGYVFTHYNQKKDEKTAGDIRVAFCGTQTNRLGGSHRDTESDNPGSISFKANEDEMIKAFEKILKGAPEKVFIEIDGQSLGGADAQHCFVMLLRKIQEHKTAENSSSFTKIKKIRLMIFNSPGIAQATANEAAALIKALVPSSVEIEYYPHLAHGDPVQPVGETTLGADESLNYMTTCLLKIFPKPKDAATSAILYYASYLYYLPLVYPAIATTVNGYAAHTHHYFAPGCADIIQSYERYVIQSPEKMQVSEPDKFLATKKIIQKKLTNKYKTSIVPSVRAMVHLGIQVINGALIREGLTARIENPGDALPLSEDYVIIEDEKTGEERQEPLRRLRINQAAVFETALLHFLRRFPHPSLQLSQALVKNVVIFAAAGIHPPLNLQSDDIYLLSPASPTSDSTEQQDSEELEEFKSNSDAEQKTTPLQQAVAAKNLSLVRTLLLDERVSDTDLTEAKRLALDMVSKLASSVSENEFILMTIIARELHTVIENRTKVQTKQDEIKLQDVGKASLVRVWLLGGMLPRKAKLAVATKHKALTMLPEPPPLVSEDKCSAVTTEELQPVNKQSWYNTLLIFSTLLTPAPVFLGLAVLANLVKLTLPTSFIITTLSHVTTLSIAAAAALTFGLIGVGLINTACVYYLWNHGQKEIAAGVGLLSVVGAATVLFVASNPAGWILLGLAFLLAVGATIIVIAQKKYDFYRPNARLAASSN